jgi:hypothetical protein
MAPILLWLPPPPVSGMLGMMVDVEGKVGEDVEEALSEGVMMDVTTKFVSLQPCFKCGYQTYQLIV